MKPGPLPGMNVAGATVSNDGVYRYDLTRRWAFGGTGVVWVMLNPSTADDSVDDPTLRRCISFSKREGFSHLLVVNLYALRTPHPSMLADHPDPIGPDNPFHVKRALANHRIYPVVIAAWGAGGARRGTWLEGLAARYDRTLYCLGETRTFQPRHPLYLPAETPLTVWRTP